MAATRAKVPSRMLSQVAYAVRVDGQRIVLACKRCGHEWPVDPWVSAAKSLSYWSRENSGVTTFCPKCDPKDYRAAERRLRAKNKRLGITPR